MVWAAGQTPKRCRQWQGSDKGGSQQVGVATSAMKKLQGDSTVVESSNGKDTQELEDNLILLTDSMGKPRASLLLSLLKNHWLPIRKRN